MEAHVIQFVDAMQKGAQITPMAEQAAKQAKPGVEILAELYETHFEKVSRYIAARIGNPSLAEDMASEVFVKAVEAFDNFQWRSIPIEAWIFKIAHNTVIDYYRKSSKRKDLPLEAATTQVSMSTSDQVDLILEIKELSQAMQSLTEQQRHIMAMRFGAGMDSQSVAKALGKKSGAVRELQSSAIRKLRTLMQKPPRTPNVSAQGRHELEA